MTWVRRNRELTLSLVSLSINPCLKIGWCQARKKPSRLNSKWALKLEGGKEWGKENLQMPIMLTRFHLAKYPALGHGQLGVLRGNIRKCILFSAASIYSFKFFICKVCIQDVIFNKTSALCPPWLCVISFWPCLYFDIHKTVAANSKVQVSVFVKSTLIGFKPVDKMNSACFKNYLSLFSFPIRYWILGIASVPVSSLSRMLSPRTDGFLLILF